MAKYIQQSSGDLQEVNPITASTGVSDASKILQTDASGKLDQSFLPTGIGADIAILVASEALSAGDFVNVFDDTGTPKVRLADASSGKVAHGFVKAGAALGANATVYFEGPNDQVTGATAGVVYLSATTPGGFSSTPPSAGNDVQKIGVATSATSINFHWNQRIKTVA